MRESKSPTCPDCGAKIGELHKPRCDVERCPRCGRQMLRCIHSFVITGRRLDDQERMPWTGEWPGEAECREYGWFAKRDPSGPGYVPCAADDPEAGPDLNRLSREAVWDPQQKRFVKKDDGHNDKTKGLKATEPGAE